MATKKTSKKGSQPTKTAKATQIQAKTDDSQQRGPETQKKASEPPQPDYIPTIRFTSAGWCEELRRSYFIGDYQPQSWEEFHALKKYGEVQA